MSKGRPRKQAKREPNGRPQREPQWSPGEAKRLRTAALAGMRQPEWGTEVGRLVLAQRISDAEHEAAKRWCEIDAAYRKAKGLPAPHERAVALERLGKSEAPEPDGQYIANALERHARFHAVVVACGLLAERTLTRVVVRDEPLAGADDLMRLRAVLRALAISFGLPVAALECPE